MNNQSQSGRREFLQTLGTGALGLALAGSVRAATTKPLRGVFPIGQTPVTPDDKLDLDCLQLMTIEVSIDRDRNDALILGFLTWQSSFSWPFSR